MRKRGDGVGSGGTTAFATHLNACCPEFEILHGDLKSLHVVIGGNQSLYNRCLILDDKPEVWARRDQPRVVAMAPYYERSPAKCARGLLWNIRACKHPLWLLRS